MRTKEELLDFLHRVVGPDYVIVDIEDILTKLLVLTTRIPYQVP